MKNAIFTCKIIITAIFLWSWSCCHDDHNYPIGPPAPTAQEFASIRTEAFNNLKQEFTFNAEDGLITLTTQNGSTITFDASCLTKDGEAVTGPVTLEYAEIFKRGHMLAANKPTMGNMGDNNLALLLSGGEFHLNAHQNGEPIETACGFQLTVPGSLTGGIDNAMTLWNGAITDDDNLVWTENPQNNEQNGVFTEGSNYHLLSQNFGWTNIDRFYNDSRPKTTLYVDPPLDYNPSNCAVYISYNGEPHALAFLDKFDRSTGLFSEHYGQIPVGLECHIIFVSEHEGEWTYAVKDETIQPGEVIAFSADELATITEANLISLIDNLP